MKYTCCVWWLAILLHSYVCAYVTHPWETCAPDQLNYWQGCVESHTTQTTNTHKKFTALRGNSDSVVWGKICMFCLDKGQGRKRHMMVGLHRDKMIWHVTHVYLYVDLKMSQTCVAHITYLLPHTDIVTGSWEQKHLGTTQLCFTNLKRPISNDWCKNQHQQKMENTFHVTISIVVLGTV